MDLILFSGNSFIHKKWIREVDKVLQPLFDRTYIQYYKHWESGEPVILLDHELSEVEKIIGSHEDYVIFGKSAGTLLGLKGIFEGVLHPEKCIFVGLPVEWGKHYGFEVDEWTKNFSVPTLFIQKAFDPVLYFDDLVSYLQKQKVEHYETKRLEGEDHYYEDLELLKSLTSEFIRK